MQLASYCFRSAALAGLITTFLTGVSAQQTDQPASTKPLQPAAASPAPSAVTTPQTPPSTPVPPPSAPAKRVAAELQKLVEPIALYPDALLATLLPASVYPLEIVQAARLMADPKSASTLDQQPWDTNVKAIAKIPDALKKLNDNLAWTAVPCNKINSKAPALVSLIILIFILI